MNPKRLNRDTLRKKRRIYFVFQAFYTIFADGYCNNTIGKVYFINNIKQLTT